MKLLCEEFPIRKKISNNKDSVTSIEKGDVLVSWVCDLLCSPEYNHIISEVLYVSGISNSIFDIIFRIKNNHNMYGIQVKTLCKINEEIWSCMTRIEQSYPENTLMIGIKEDFSGFVLGYWRDFVKNKNGMHIFFDFNNNNTSYESLKFYDLIYFKTQLSKMLFDTVVIYDVRETIKNVNCLQEFDSLRILKEEVEKKHMKFEYHWTQGSPIDIYINGHTCQCKSTTVHDHHMYTFPLLSSYSRSDVEFFIFQIADNHYKTDICIVPISVLIHNNIIGTDDAPGLTCTSIPPPNHFKYHWSDSMWNNFKLINDPIIVDPMYNFTQRYQCSIRDTSTVVRGKYAFKIRLFDLKSDYIMICINNRKKKLWKDYIWCISPHDLEIEKRIPTTKVKEKKIYIVSPNCTDQDWSLKYWKKITHLDSIKSP